MSMSSSFRSTALLRDITTDEKYIELIKASRLKLEQAQKRISQLASEKESLIRENSSLKDLLQKSIQREDQTRKKIDMDLFISQNEFENLKSLNENQKIEVQKYKILVDELIDNNSCWKEKYSILGNNLEEFKTLREKFRGLKLDHQNMMQQNSRNVNELLKEISILKAQNIKETKANNESVLLESKLRSVKLENEKIHDMYYKEIEGRKEIDYKINLMNQENEDIIIDLQREINSLKGELYSQIDVITSQELVIQQLNSTIDKMNAEKN